MICFKGASASMSMVIYFAAITTLSLSTSGSRLPYRYAQNDTEHISRNNFRLQESLFDLERLLPLRCTATAINESVIEVETAQLDCLARFPSKWTKSAAACKCQSKDETLKTVQITHIHKPNRKVLYVDYKRSRNMGINK